MFKTALFIKFIQPWFLLLLIPAVWFWWKSKQKEGYVIRWNQQNTPEPSIKLKLYPFIQYLLPLAFTALICAMARPVKLFQEEKIKADGIDIVLSMDLSGSMLAKDFEPDRLSVSKMLAQDFVNQRTYDRIGLVVFAGESFTQCPVTTNHDIVNGFLNNLEVGILQDGTAIGMGLATSVNRLKDSKAASKIIILLTDGENNAGYIDPVTGIDMAKALGVKVYTIGVGTTGIALMPLGRDNSGQYYYGPKPVKIDEDLLNKIAFETGGKYFRAKNKEDLANIYSEIDRLEKTEIEVNIFRRQSEFFRPFVLSGVGLFLLYFGLLFIWIKKYF